jgi:hypothetical protein
MPAALLSAPAAPLPESMLLLRLLLQGGPTAFSSQGCIPAVITAASVLACALQQELLEGAGLPKGLLCSQAGRIDRVFGWCEGAWTCCIQAKQLRLWCTPRCILPRRTHNARHPSRAVGRRSWSLLDSGQIDGSCMCIKDGALQSSDDTLGEACSTTPYTVGLCTAPYATIQHRCRGNIEFLLPVLRVWVPLPLHALSGSLTDLVQALSFLQTTPHWSTLTNLRVISSLTHSACKIRPVWPELGLAEIYLPRNPIPARILS